ncbi:MAG TPA: M56 family metallopeptidase [Saprospiraceae bacterium]|nr:M56 family metallopeptidase [Saprospiraceae bacterium]HMP26344.1 M56 family metallopeptidase [Saprospiraceae bacterium]
MHIIHHYISEALIYALGWTVVHTLWQAAGIALLLAGLLPLLQKKSAILRYWLAYAALVLVFGLAIATFWDLYASARAFSVVEITRLTIPDAPHAAIADSPPLLQRWQQYFDTHLPMLVSLWLLGVVFFVLRLLGGLVYLKRLKTAHTAPVDTHWEELLAYLAQRMAVQRPVRLLESALVQTPVVLGHLKPLILLPVGMVNALSITQVEAILAHELAHIARYDYLLNVLQSFIEALLYFNPAVWWFSAVIRAEREHCCDDRALQVCDNSFAYAKALVAIQEMHRPAPGLAMAFGHQKKHLLHRIQRILQQPQNRTNIMEKITATCLLLAAIIGLSINATRPHAQPAPATPDLVILDTVPKQSSVRYDGKRGTQKVELKVENDKITYLKVDGREIPAKEYPKYQSLVEDIMGDVPPPPPAPERPEVPAPPAPLTPPAPPAPPTPPAHRLHLKSKAPSFTGLTTRTTPKK